MNVTLLTRFEALEKRHRRVRRLGTISFLISFLLLALAVCQYTGVEIVPAKALYTQSLYVKNAEGRICAEMSAYGELTLFSIYDRNNQPRVALSLLKDEPAIHLYDHQGIRRAVFGLGNTGPSMMFMTPSGVEISGLATRTDGSTNLFLDKPGAAHEKAPTQEQAVHEEQSQLNINQLMNKSY